MLRKRFLIILMVFFALSLAASASGWACMTAALNSGGHRLIGKNYDWNNNHGIVHVNQRNVTKRAMLTEQGIANPPLTWTSKYASVTFNQYGRDFANGGMNEAGLVVESMEMQPSVDYLPKGAPAVGQLQWMQYMLDSFGTVAEVVKAAPGVGVTQNMVNSHYMACDKTECATFEVVGTTLKITRGQDLGIQTPDGKFVPVTLLTNDRYACSRQYLTQFQGFGGSLPVPTGEYCQNAGNSNYQCNPCRNNPDKAFIAYPGVVPQGVDLLDSWRKSNSIARFVRAAGSLQSLNLLLADPKAPAYQAKPGQPKITDPAVQGMFDVLNSAYDMPPASNAPPENGRQGGTRWQIVYDPQGGKIYWRTDADANGKSAQGLTGTPRLLPLATLPLNILDCKNNVAVQTIQMQAPATPAPSPVDYTEAANIALVSYGASFPVINLDGFKSAISSSFKSMQPAEVSSMINTIWGGYPAGFTTCNGPVTDDKVTNLSLRAAMPYISRLVSDQMPASGADGPTGGGNCENSDPKKKNCFIPDYCYYNEKTKYSYVVKNIQGLKAFALTSLKLSGGTFSFTANLGAHNLTGTVYPVIAWCNNLLGDWPAYCTNPFAAPVSMSGSGTVVSQSPSAGNVCFKNAALTAFSIPAKAIDVTCGPCTGQMIDKFPLTKGLICGKISDEVNTKKGDIYGGAEKTIKAALTTALPGFFPACP